MRLLAVSDLHYRLPHYDWLLGAAADVDAVALSGDLLDVVNPVPVDVQAVVMGNYLTKLADRAAVFAASGNHDLDGPGAHGELIATWLRRQVDTRIHTDGESVDLEGLRITVCPWWDGPISRQEVAEQLAAAAVDRPAQWIWLYHAPPAGTPLCNDGRREFPDTDVAAWIEEYQPDLVLSGHIHQAPWVTGGSWHGRIGRTVIFNPGKQIGRTPPHVTIDTVAGTAHWFGVFESETIDLR